jgi:hypothetical protein
MTAEPQFFRTSQGPAHQNGRWLWWYSQIADWMIRHPGGRLQDCAKDLNKNVNTISAIKNSDTFKEYYYRRREEYQRNHDDAIRNKLTAVTEASLDVILDKIQTQSKQIPMDTIREVAFGGLEKLGYGTKPHGVQVNVAQSGDRSTVVVATASLSELEAARQALRIAESSKGHKYLPEPDPLDVIDLPSGATPEPSSAPSDRECGTGAEPPQDATGEVRGAPIPIPS